MRWLVLILSVLLSYLLGTELAQACNQEVYDKIYRSIVVTALTSDGSTSAKERHVMLERNSTIEALRGLCNGQRSTYETDRPRGDK